MQVRVNERHSKAKAVIGSGFFIRPQGLLITNYHVVDDLVLYPERYVGEVRTVKNRTYPLEVVNVDVIYDLALIKIGYNNKKHFKINDVPLHKGEPLYSMGNPQDLGFLIVEGTYNGFIDVSMYERIHFIGSINSGMSGGPAVTTDGKLAGVNVRSRGRQLSSIVPAKYVERLLLNTDQQDPNQTLDFKEIIGRQLTENQSSYIRRFLKSSFDKVVLGNFQLPSRFSDDFKCWGNVRDKENEGFRSFSHNCYLGDHILISSKHKTSKIFSKHLLIENKNLNTLQFFKLYQKYFKADYGKLTASGEDVTNFSCHQDNIINNDIPLEAIFCVRAYKKFEGLYDLVLRVAALDRKDRGLLSTVVVAGVSFENARRFALKYLKEIRWHE